MNSAPVQLWRTTPVEAGRSAARAPGIDERHVFPSARQALNGVVARLGHGRRSYVGIPDFASHCVIDFLSRRATAVPTRFLGPADADAVLIYDQWGWQRPEASRLKVQQHFSRATILWDRVDSLPGGFEAAARLDAMPRTFQVFSLSKTLGAGGGGLLWEGDGGWVDAGLPTGDGFAEALERWLVESPFATESHYGHLDRFFRNELPGWPPALQRWLREHNVDAAAREEAAERRCRLELCVSALKPRLAPWMMDPPGSERPAPGILPVRLRATDPELVRTIRSTLGLELCFYHFDFSEQYTEPLWQRVLPVPLHSQISLEQLEGLCRLLRSGGLA